MANCTEQISPMRTLNALLDKNSVGITIACLENSQLLLIIVPFLNRCNGEEIAGDPLGIDTDKLVYPRLRGRVKDHPDVLWLIDLIHDLDVVILRGIGLIDVGEGKRYSRKIFAAVLAANKVFRQSRSQAAPIHAKG